MNTLPSNWIPLCHSPITYGTWLQSYRCDKLRWWTELYAGLPALPCDTHQLSALWQPLWFSTRQRGGNAEKEERGGKKQNKHSHKVGDQRWPTAEFRKPPSEFSTTAVAPLREKRNEMWLLTLHYLSVSQRTTKCNVSVNERTVVLMSFCQERIKMPGRSEKERCRERERKQG